MRLWHKDLIPVLPRQQLLSQWRECCAIARNIAVNGTPNHILVNPVLDYPMEHFCRYSAYEVYTEMVKREYFPEIEKFKKWFIQIQGNSDRWISHEELFSDWHNDRYLRQCYYNLEEKHDRGGISDEEWQKIEDFANIS